MKKFMVIVAMILTTFASTNKLATEGHQVEQIFDIRYVYEDGKSYKGPTYANMGSGMLWSGIGEDYYTLDRQTVYVDYRDEYSAKLAWKYLEYDVHTKMFNIK